MNTYKIAIGLPLDVYEKVKRRAAKAKKSFSAEAVDLIKCGLLDVEDSERHEPKTKGSTK